MTFGGTTDSNSKRRHVKSLFEYPALPKIELQIYILIVVSTTIYAWSNVLITSQKFKFKLGQMASVHHLPIFGERFRDDSNWEWNRWKTMAIKFLPFLIGHSVFYNTIGCLLPENILELMVTLYSMMIACAMFGPWLLFISICQAVIVFVSALHTRHCLGVWLGALPILYYTMHYTMQLSGEPFMVLVFVSYTLLSAISFNLDMLAGEHRPQDNSTLKLFKRMLFYIYYPPYMITLVVIYADFERQMQHAHLRDTQWRQVLWFGARIAFWWFVIEFILHFFYFEAMLYDLDYARHLPKDQFVTLGMALGVFFHLKYVVIFGVPSFFAKLDRMQPADGPICTARVTLYSKIWRSFDRGLYAFFKKYIFIPICAPTFSIGRKLFGVLLSYAFVLVWHGFRHANIVWIVLNILGLLIEYAGKGLYTIDDVRGWREAHLSDVAFRRVLAWLHIIPFACGLYSNFYFLGGSSVGYMFVQRMWIEETLTLRYPALLLITLGYFFANVCIEVERRSSMSKSSDDNTDSIDCSSSNSDHKIAKNNDSYKSKKNN